MILELKLAASTCALDVSYQTMSNHFYSVVVISGSIIIFSLLSVKPKQQQHSLKMEKTQAIM